MSFSDLMSSGRGPGVIGMVMALIVLLGFGLLFMFAFDEGFQGADQSIESVIRTQQKDLDNYQTGIEKGRKSLDLAPGRIAASKDLARLKGENAALQEKISVLTESVAAEKAAVAASEDEFEGYKDQYRAFVRGKAKGTAMEVLETTTGIVYKNVNIREVSAVGIQIRHEEGQKRIAFEDLPESMKDYYQFDPAQKDKALAHENATRDQHEAAVAVANEQADQEMAKQREKNAELAKERLVREIAGKQAQLEALKDEISSLQRDVDRADRAAAAARASGKMHINKAGSIKSKIKAKKSRYSVIQAEILQMKSRL